MHAEVKEWFTHAQRPLPWRGAEPWPVMVSEFMLQQTPVSRVLPVWQEWIERWPSPAHLAAAPTDDVLRAWGRLGYPRRAMRLQEAARRIVSDHDGVVPDDYDALIGLPGVGDYTAAAILSFAFGRRHVVLDTNVRRVIARAVLGEEYPSPSPTAAERRLATDLLPESDAHVWAAGTMELGALICTASNPACEQCPISPTCRWLALGRPRSATVRRGQAFAGTDRQARGVVMAILREATGPVARGRLDEAWEDRVQLDRVLYSLLADGLMHTPSGNRDQFLLGPGE